MASVLELKGIICSECGEFNSAKDLGIDEKIAPRVYQCEECDMIHKTKEEAALLQDKL